MERRASTQSIQESTRQHLQNPNTRRIYVVENEFDTTEFDTINLTNTSVIPLVTDNQNQQDLALNPLNHSITRNFNPNIIEVHIRCIFLRVGEIDTLNERYYAEILLEASWETSSFQNLQNRSFDPAIHWTPRLELMNGIGQLQDEITYGIHYDKQGIATITEHHKLKGTLWERMELKDFPMDIQALSILITTSRANSEMIFVKNLEKPSGVYRRIFTDEQEWYLFEHVDMEISEQIDEYLDNEHNHSVVICSCHVARKYGYFMWNAYFLIFLITSASFTTFPIPLANIFGRVQIACTLLLTSITFRWLCNKALPTISYLTALDVYAIGSIFSLCFLNIFHGVIGYINYYISTNTNGPSMTATTNVPNIIVIDRWALVIFAIVFFAYQIGTFIWICLVPWKKRGMLFKKDKENRLHIPPSSNNSKATFPHVLLRTKRTFSKQNDLSIVSNITF